MLTQKSAVVFDDKAVRVALLVCEFINAARGDVVSSHRMRAWASLEQQAIDAAFSAYTVYKESRKKEGRVFKSYETWSRGQCEEACEEVFDVAWLRSFGFDPVDQKPFLTPIQRHQHEMAMEREG